MEAQRGLAVLHALAFLEVPQVEKLVLLTIDEIPRSVEVGG